MKSRAKLRGLVSRVRSMTDKPAPTSPRPPIVFPPHWRDVTAEKVGTVTVIVGDGRQGHEAGMTDADGGRKHSNWHCKGRDNPSLLILAVFF
jgi:hypothetical protein